MKRQIMLVTLSTAPAGAFVTSEKSLRGAGLDIDQLDAVVSKGEIPDGVNECDVDFSS